MTETQCLGGSTIHSLVTFLKTKITSDYQVEKNTVKSPEVNRYTIQF